MADGLNDARAMRIAEVMADFRAIAHRVSALNRTTPNQRSFGALMMKNCQDKMRNLLAKPFNGTPPAADAEETKSQLKRILLDAAARRYKAQEILRQTECAARCIARYAQNREERAADATLRSEIPTITSQSVFSELQRRDQAAGHWTAQMPDLNAVLAYARAL